MQQMDEEIYDVEKILGRRLRNGLVSFIFQYSSTCRKFPFIVTTCSLLAI